MSWHDREWEPEPCEACGGSYSRHGAGCPLDAWEMEMMHEHYRLEELHLAAAVPDEAEMTTQPEHATA